MSEDVKTQVHYIKPGMAVWVLHQNKVQHCIISRVDIEHAKYQWSKITYRLKLSSDRIELPFSSECVFESKEKLLASL